MHNRAEYNYSPLDQLDFFHSGLVESIYKEIAVDMTRNGSGMASIQLVVLVQALLITLEGRLDMGCAVALVVQVG